MKDMIDGEESRFEDGDDDEVLKREFANNFISRLLERYDIAGSQGQARDLIEFRVRSLSSQYTRQIPRDVFDVATSISRSATTASLFLPPHMQNQGHGLVLLTRAMSDDTGKVDSPSSGNFNMSVANNGNGNSSKRQKIAFPHFGGINNNNNLPHYHPAAASAAAAALASGTSNLIPAGPYEDDDDKQKKRRAQIAEASRRSRARRKQEFQNLKEENSTLWKHIFKMDARLRELGEFNMPPPERRPELSEDGGDSDDVDSPDLDPVSSSSSSSSTTTNTASSSEAESSPSHQALVNAHFSSSSSYSAGPTHQPQNDSSHPDSPPSTSSAITSLSLSPTTTTTSSSSAEESRQPAVQPLLLPDNDPAVVFFERRCRSYLTELKEDYINTLGKDMSIVQKQKIYGVQIKLMSLAPNHHHPNNA